jgi:hypothetical protein
MTPRSLRVVALAMAVVGAGVVRGRRRATPPAASIWPDAIVARVPHLTGSITLDGDTDDAGWRGPTLRTGPFVADDGVTPQHPQTEARIVWGDGFLYMVLYAADEDIEVRSKAPDSLSADEDSFHLVFTDGTRERILDLNPMGVVTDAERPRGANTEPDRSWDSHAHVSREIDGSPNDPRNNDEEWVLEVAIPFEAIGLAGAPGESVGLSMHRCDTPHDGKRRCGTWGETVHRVLVLE